jgi:rhodanese-related sulfurtransferase
VSAGWIDLEPHQVEARAERARVVDVREPHELGAELGAIAGAENVPLATLSQAATRWSIDEELILVCRSGGRSSRAAEFLAGRGFRRLHNLRGGMLAWNAAGLPVRRAA